MLINRNEVVLRDNQIYNLVAPDVTKNFIEIVPDSNPVTLSWIKEPSYMRFYISLCLDKKTYSRNSYTTVDLLGNVAAFFLALYFICAFFIFLVLNGRVLLENLLMNRIFRRKISDSMQLAYVKINYRQYALSVLTATCCLRRPRHVLWRTVALRRVNRELDLAHFIRKQLILDGMIHALTTVG